MTELNSMTSDDNYIDEKEHFITQHLIITRRNVIRYMSNCLLLIRNIHGWENKA